MNTKSTTMLLGVAVLVVVSGASRAPKVGATDYKPASIQGQQPVISGASATTRQEEIQPLEYDESVGDGVDASGFTNLPLRSGASRYFVNSATGSDSNSCTAAKNPRTPKATVMGGYSCVAWATNNARGPGDQLMLAEGTSYADGFNDALGRHGGFSAKYPTVFQSYDPADPLNETRHGRAGTVGHAARPVIRSRTVQGAIHGSTPNNAFIVIRGLDFDPGNVQGVNLIFTGGIDYLLFENNVFRAVGLGLNSVTNKEHHILRKNSFYGQWSGVSHAQGVYDDLTTGITIEDNIFWHNGWKTDVTRSATEAQGGPTIFNHAIYLATTTYDVKIRRNVIIDPSSHGVQARGDSEVTRNVYIDNPLVQVLGLGDNYDTKRPDGVLAKASRNLIIGDADISPVLPRGQVFNIGNTKPGSSVTDNLILQSRNNNAKVFMPTAQAPKPTYIDISNNLIYRYGVGAVAPTGAYVNQVFATYNNNIWDSPTQGTNLINTSLGIASPPTAQSVYTFLGCNTKQACVNKMIETPDQPWAERIRMFMFKAYGR